MKQEERIAGLCRALRRIETDPNDTEKWNFDQVAAIMRRVQQAGQPLLSNTPRRGTVLELGNLYDMLRLHAQITESEFKAAKSKDMHIGRQAVELWREAECLALSPHSMSRLKQLPELQQIIAHTTLNVIHTCGSKMQHLFAEQSEEQRMRGLGSSSDSDWLDDLDTSDNRYSKAQQQDDANLLQHLTPALRLCLAAEVAVGMLCPGQPPPPDTPEHAAALQVFVAEAFNHIQHELANTPSVSRNEPVYNSSVALQMLWQGLATERPVQRFFKPEHVWRQLVAPHFDLQLQLPPQQLLQLLLELEQQHRVLQQQQQQPDSRTQQQQSLGQLAAAQIGSTQQQQRQQNASQQCSLPFDVAALPPHHQLQLQQLLPHWIGLDAERSSSTGVDSSSSGGSSTSSGVTSLVQQCMQLLHQAQLHVTESAQQQGSQTAAEAAESAETAAAAAASACVPDAVAFTTVCQQSLKLAGRLILKFLQDQWQSCGCNAAAPAWQQEVPLQVLLLLAQLQQLQGTLEGMLAIIQHPQEDDDMGQQQKQQQEQDSEHVLQQQHISNCWEQQQQEGTEQQQQQQGAGQQHRQPVLLLMAADLCFAMQQVLAMLQCTRQFAEINATLNAAAAVATAASLPHGAVGRPGAADISDGLSAMGGNQTDGSSSSNSNSSAVPVEPAVFFSAAGPLASRVLGGSESAGMGVWHALPHNIQQLSVASGHHQQQQQQYRQQHKEGVPSAGSKAGKLRSPDSQAGPDNQAAVISVPAGVYSCQAQPGPAISPGTSGPDSQAGLVSGLNQPQVPQAQPDCQAQPLQLLTWQVLFGSCAWQQAVEKVNVELAFALAGMPDEVLMQLVSNSTRKSHAPDSNCRRMLAAYAQKFSKLGAQGMASQLWDAAGLTETAASLIRTIRMQAFADIGFDVRPWTRAVDCQKQRMQIQQRGDFEKLEGSGLGRKEGAMTTFDAADIEEAKARGILDSDDEDSKLDSSSDEDDEQDDCAVGTLARLIQVQLNSHCNGVAGSSNGEAAAAAAPAGPGAAPMQPQLADEAKQALKALKHLTAAVSSQFVPLRAWHTNWVQQQGSLAREALDWWKSDERKALVKAAVLGKNHIPKHKSAHAAASSTVANGFSSSSSGSSSSGGTKGASWGWEVGHHDHHASCPLCQREQQKQEEQKPCGSGRYSDPAVPYTDPFMWRRLLWQLLGKLSPEAQAFYAHYLAMCPHSTDFILWHHVRRSLFNCLWSSPAADAAEQQLSCQVQMTLKEERARSKQLRLYARALNASYMEGYSSFGPLIAHHLLLALSPLHAQVLPRPEVAFLLPSSFRPAVGKALQQQLLSRPVLDQFQHHSAKLQMWHVWWHIGIRRYVSLQQQQQQQQQHGAAVNSPTPDQIDQLYLDPDAKLYAAAFALRQLTGSISSSSSSISLLGSFNKPDRLNSATAAAIAAHDGAQNFIRKLREAGLSEVSARAIAPDLRRILDWLKGARVHGAFLASDHDTASTTQPDQPTDKQEKLKGLFESLMMDLGGDDAAQLFAALELPAVEGVLSGAGERQWQELQHCQAGLTAVLEHFTGAEGDLGAVAAGFEDWQDQHPREAIQAETDIEQAALQPPCPIEAFMDQHHWIQTEELLTDGVTMMNGEFLCDLCGLNVDSTEPGAGCCDRCFVARYCSSHCLREDAAAHALVCKQLAAGRRRYSRCSNTKCTAPACEHGKHYAFSRLRHLLHHPQESAVHSFGAGAGAVTRQGGAVEASELLSAELFVQEYGRLFSDAASAALRSGASGLNLWQSYSE